MNTSSTDPWEMGPIIAAGTAVAIDTAREPEPERRPPAEPEPEPGLGLEPDARCVDDAGSEDRANPAVDPWEIGPLPSASNPVGNDIPADAPASEPQHVGGAVEPADLADTIDLTPVGDRDAAMPVREWRRMATTAGGILLAACVTVAGMSAWESHESATAARELEQATADCAAAHAAAKKAERKLVEYLDGDRLAQAKAVTADKLAEPETLETLDKLAEQYSEGERIPACAATDTETANATTSKLQAIEKKHTGNLSRLKKATGAPRLKNELAARLFDSQASFIMPLADLSTSAVHVSNVAWNVLTSPARHTALRIAHMKALPKGIRSRPSCWVTSFQPAAITPHTAAMIRNGSTCIRM